MEIVSTLRMFGGLLLVMAADGRYYIGKNDETKRFIPEEPFETAHEAAERYEERLAGAEYDQAKALSVVGRLIGEHEHRLNVEEVLEEDPQAIAELTKTVDYLRIAKRIIEGRR